MSKAGQIEEKLAGLRLMVLDVDGVMTDGRLYLGENGQALAAFDIRDGAGLRFLLEAGVEVALLTGRKSSAITARAEYLGIKYVVQVAATGKGRAMRELLEKLKVAPEAALFCGDELFDLPAMAAAGISACVADAAPEVRAAAVLVLDSPGGRGAVRELCQRILKAKGLWEGIVGRFRSQGG